jgi:hypothetical protein
MKNPPILFMCIIYLSILTGCATVKNPQVSGINKLAGIVELNYEYGLFEKPQVNWDEAKKTANSQCQSLGFKPAQQSSEPNDECISRTNNGGCAQHKVTANFQCELSPEQFAKLKDAEKKAEDEMNQKKKAQQNFLNNLSSFQEVVICRDSGYGEQARIMANQILEKYINNDIKGYSFLLESWVKQCTTNNKTYTKDYVMTHGKLISYNQNSAYYIITWSKLKDGVNATIGIVGK